MISLKFLNKIIVILLLLSVSVSSVQGRYADNLSEYPVVNEIEIEKLQKEISDQGYNYKVKWNWIAHLSPEQRDALCGYRHEVPFVGIIAEDAVVSSENATNFFVRDMATTDQFRDLTVSETLPTSYDAMDLGYVSPVRDQGNCGSCWIFAAVADFESDISINEDILVDFSEQEVGDCNIWSTGAGRDFCDGGNSYYTTNYFTKYGASEELCKPYVASSGACNNCPIQKNVDNWRMITQGDGQNRIDEIKNAIIEYGPVYSTIYASDSSFNYYDSGVYEYDGSEETNHAVQIIGWDDEITYSGGSGAWLIKNSWGTGWGASGPYQGCAWVAYGSANLGDYTSAIAGYGDPQDNLFYHDEYGWQGTALGYPGSTTAYGGVRYTPSEDLVLSAIDFWAAQPQAQYEITLFDTLNDLDGGIYSFGDQLGVTQSGTTDEQGYYSIILDTPVEVTSGNDFIVQIKFTTPNSYPLPIDYASNSAFSYESYISPNGVNFKKPSSYGYPYDIGIRARGELAKVHNLNTIEDFITIQEAIDDSYTTNGHIIELDVGTYSENIVLSKSVTLRSSSGDPTDTIINAADPEEHLIKITTDDVNIGNLTLKGATSANKAGIFADGVDLCRIENNNITDNYYGIYLDDSSSNYLKLNLVSGNINSGFYLTGGSTGNEIFFNNIYANSDYGFVNDQSSDVDATQNWWGTTVNDTINASIYDHYDDSSLGEVIYIPKQSSYIHAPVPEVTTMISLLIGLLALFGYINRYRR